jgi:hypothetical protein
MPAWVIFFRRRRLGMDKDIEQSRRLARRIKSRGKKGFESRWRAIETVARYADAVLVEGLAVNRKFRLPFEHAWLEHAGVILDTNLPDADLAYFPGLRFPGRDGLATAAALPEMLECGTGVCCSV